MRLKADEYLKLTILLDKSERVLDVRVWKRTPTGGVFTRKSLTMPKKLLIPLIIGLQKIHQAESAIESKTTEVA